MRIFFERVAVKTKNSPETDYLSAFFGKSPDDSNKHAASDDDDQDNEVAATNATEPQKLLTTGIRSKVIMFDGDYREKEIDKFFAINPESKNGEHISYSK